MFRTFIDGCEYVFERVFVMCKCTIAYTVMIYTAIQTEGIRVIFRGFYCIRVIKLY